MTATQALLWALVVAATCVAVGMFLGFTAAWLQERAYQRAREAEYAQQVLNARFARHVQERKSQRERDLHDHAHYEGKPE